MPDADGPALDKALRLPALERLGPDAGLLAEAVVEAGRAALAHWGRDPQVWLKAGDSPVSEADLEADRLLRARLLAARPDHGWLSEETADSADRLDRSRVFVVDPIDGTRAFIAGDAVWAVSAALVEAGRPIAAALFQPVTGDLMVAARGAGAWRAAGPLAASPRARLEGARLAGPRKFRDHAAARAAGVEVQAFVPSLALRIAWVADGRLDVALASARSHDWDLAAADLLVHEAGGSLATLDGTPVSYNARVPRHPPLVAAAPGIAAASLGLLRAMAA